jgi:hypothetical protein
MRHFVKEKSIVLMITMGVTIPALVIVTGMWSPRRWAMYIDTIREVAPINFYGRVVDDQGKPLSGVRVELEVSKPNWLFILGAERRLARVPYQMTTGQDGQFRLVGKSGSAVRAKTFSLPGYEFKPQTKGGVPHTTFDYAGAGASAGNAHKPDPNNPVAFTMRECNGDIPE